MFKKLAIIISCISVLAIFGYVFIKPTQPIYELTINTDINKPKFLVDTQENMQGNSYFDHHYYIGFDIGDNHGIIEKYSMDGELIHSSKPLEIGHTAEIDFRYENNHIYVANGGRKNPAKIYEVDYQKEKVVGTIDLSELGNSALLTVDNDNDRLIVHTSKNDKSTPVFSIVEFDGTIIDQFKTEYQGVPQGLEVYNDTIYFYTNDTITELDFEGTVKEQYNLDFEGESEGMTIVDDGDPYLSVGYNRENRIYELK